MEELKEQSRNQNGRRYNYFIRAIAAINAYYCILPHFTGGSLDINHVFIVMFIGVFFVYFVLIPRVVDRITFFALIIVLFSGFFVLYRANSISIDYFTKWIEFASSIMLYIIVLSAKEILDETTIRTVYLCYLLAIVIYFIESLDSSFYTHTNTGYKLVLTCTNQNSAAMQLLMMGSLFFMFSRIFMDQGRKKAVFFNFLVIVAILYMIYRTGSRSTLIGVLLILLFFIRPKLMRFINNRVIAILILVPLIFSVVFVALYNVGYDNIIILGRNLYNGREEMWSRVFSQPLINWIFGSYHVFTRDTGHIPFQLHNGTVDMIASYGFPVTMGFLYCIYKVFCNINSKDTGLSHLIVICGLALILESTGEAALFIGNRCTYICLLFIFNNYQYEKIGEERIIESDSDSGSMIL